MSERIDELIGKALDQAVPYTWHHLNRVQVDDTMKKFAELIVKECLNKIENEASQYAEPVWAFELVNDIKEHFGVEE
jgi:hemerythrin